MVFSNLAGTTSDVFSITKVKSRTGYGENGILLSGNTYDLFWNMSGIMGKEYMNKSVYFIANEGITDLNNCGRPGQYVCPWTYLSKLANIPEELRDTTNNFIMISHPVGTSNYDWGAVSDFSKAVQELTTSIGRRYFRTKSNSNWTAWQRVAFTSEIPTMPALHAVATSGDYNHLINKPNVSAGPTVETGTFFLDSKQVAVLNYGGNKYVKYGNVVVITLSFRCQVLLNKTGGITFSGIPLMPNHNVLGTFFSYYGSVQISGITPVLGIEMNIVNDGEISAYVLTPKGRTQFSCEMLNGQDGNISGQFMYII